MKSLERLREDLKAMEHVEGLFVFNDEFSIEFYRMKKKIIREIAMLKSDPWREAKKTFEALREQCHDDDSKCREIVRRLAEPDNLSLSEMEVVIRDATILWAEMKGVGDES